MVNEFQLYLLMMPAEHLFTVLILLLRGFRMMRNIRLMSAPLYGMLYLQDSDIELYQKINIWKCFFLSILN